MNFLSHFYFDQNSSPETIAGIALPDIYGNFSNHYNQFFKSINLNEVLEPKEKEIILGIRKHYLVDSIFHESDFFKHHCSKLKQLFTQYNLINKLPRSYFIAHVLLELILDAYLYEKNENIVDEFYSKMNRVDIKSMEIALRRYPVLELEIPKIVFNFHKFLNFEFLKLYNENKNLLHAVKKISQHHLTWQLSIDEEDLFIQIIHEFRVSEGENLGTIFEEIQTKIEIIPYI